MKSSYWSGLRVLTWSVALLAAGSFAACTDDNDEGTTAPPPVALNNQIELNGANPVEIRSAIYEMDDNDNYAFYLSPTSGITGMEEMEAAGDYLRVTVADPKGKIYPDADNFEFAYGGLTVNEHTMFAVKSLSLEVGYTEASAALKLVIELQHSDGRTLRAGYDGTCNKATLPVLENEYELDEVPTSIGSAIVWKAPAKGTTTYTFYARTGLTEPTEGADGLTVVLSDGIDASEIDLSTADPSKVKVSCGGFTSSQETTGTLHIGINAQGKLTLTLDAEQSGRRLRADYEGGFSEGFESADFIRVTEAGNAEEKALTKIFATTGVSNVLLFGQVDAAEPEELQQGHYAAALTLTANQLKGGTFDISAFRARIFDYEAYKTYDNSKVSEGMSGSLTVARTSDGKKLYLSFEVSFPDGPKLEGEWSGVTTPMSQEPDMTPVAPFRSHFTLTAADGTTTHVDKDLISVEMRMQKNYRLRGGDPAYGGATFDAYFFYFRPAGGETTSITDTYTIPQLMLSASAVPTDGELDLASGDEELHWNFKYKTEKDKLYLTEYFENYQMFGSWTYRCPDDVKVTVVKNDDKTWKITFRMVDYGRFSNYSSTKEGTQSTVLIEWEGPMTKYSGSETNDLTDADY